MVYSFSQIISKWLKSDSRISENLSFKKQNKKAKGNKRTKNQTKPVSTKTGYLCCVVYGLNGWMISKTQWENRLYYFWIQQLNMKKECWSKMRLVPILKKHSEITKIKYFLSIIMPSTLIGSTMKFETQIIRYFVFPQG